MASKAGEEEEMGSEDDSGSDTDGAELNKQRLAFEEAESKAIDEDWAYLDANDAACGSGKYIPMLEKYGSTSLDIGDFFK